MTVTSVPRVARTHVETPDRDIVSAGVVALGQVAALTTGTFATVNVVLTIVGLGVARQIAREHRRRAG